MNVRKGEAKFTERDHVAYIILLNIHKGIGYLACCCTLTSTADFCFLGKAPASCSTALSKVDSVDIYKCTNAVHVAIATEVIQLPHSQLQACFISV